MYTIIDVSSHNGLISWENVKNDNIDGAIIRIGYGNNYINQDDSMAVINMDECERLNIPYGVYIYSYAINMNEVDSEINHILRMIGNRNPKLGLWFDMEDSDGYKASHGLTDGSIMTDFCIHFVERITELGYAGGIYANLNYYNNILEIERLENCNKWLALWRNEEPDDLYRWIIWQYTSDGAVDGIDTRTDMNRYYGHIPLTIINDNKDDIVTDNTVKDSNSNLSGNVSDSENISNSTTASTILDKIILVLEKLIEIIKSIRN